jgi:hypothetical protein
MASKPFKMANKPLKWPANIFEKMPAGTYAKQIFNRLLIDLSYNSSRLEGNTYSLLETKELLLEGKGAADKLDAEKLMILNHKEAIKFLVGGIQRIDVNVESICNIHYLLSDELVLLQHAGQIRKEAVGVSATVYVPIDNHQRLTRILKLIADKAKQIEDPFEQSFFLLVHVTYLQAFIDVNKRTARLVCNIPLIRHNLVPLSFNDVDKDDYILAMIVAYELNKTLPLAELYVWTYLRSCKLYTATAESIAIDSIRVFYRQQRRQLIAEIVKGLLVDEKMHHLIKLRAKENVAKEHQKKFIEDTLVDLENIAPFNIVGMGVTKQEYSRWKELYST